MRRLLVPALLAVLAAGSARSDEATVRLGAELAKLVLTGEHSGLSVSVQGSGDGAVAVVVERFSAVGPSPGYPFSEAAECPDRSALDAEGFRELPLELMGAVRRAQTTYEVLRAVVGYVSDHVTLDDTDGGPQDAHSVLDRGRGRCSGRANLAVGLLRVLGIPARLVHGVLAGDVAGRWHRWGEAWLGPDRWTPFDPGASVGFVRVRYLPVRSTPDVQAAVPARLVAVAEGGFASLPRWRGLRIRPERGATLRCFVPGPAPVRMSLTGPDGLARIAVGGPEVVFSDLIPGRYTIRATRRADVGETIGLTIEQPGDVRITVAGSRRDGT